MPCLELICFYPSLRSGHCSATSGAGRGRYYKSLIMAPGGRERIRGTALINSLRLLPSGGDPAVPAWDASLILRRDIPMHVLLSHHGVTRMTHGHQPRRQLNL